jgi:hypothetical protein
VNFGFAERITEISKLERLPSTECELIHPISMADDFGSHSLMVEDQGTTDTGVLTFAMEGY